MKSLKNIENFENMPPITMKVVAKSICLDLVSVRPLAIPLGL